MKLKLMFLSLYSFITPYLIAQKELAPDGVGFYDLHTGLNDALSPEQKAATIKMLQANERTLKTKGLLSNINRPLATGFQWPISQSPGFNDNGFYIIANYVDEDTTSGLLDYNCGSRTYDGHQGTDIALWPFPWQKMALNAVRIVAAAPGTIIGKFDGNTDTSCGGCSGCNWNAVYVMQADGSVSWYGHMKEYSQTPKAIGQTVALGEFLGIVGSSGNSTAPHCHFQVYSDNTYSHLIDPWAGSCNKLNGLTSWWANQQPYYVSILNTIMTNYPKPTMTGCKSEEAVNCKVNFVNGDSVYFTSYYRDQQSGQLATYTIYKPDSTVYATWTLHFNAYYDASWYYYIRVLPNPAPSGMWRYDVAYNGQVPLSTYFAVNETGYTFTGNGNWDIATNWSNNTVPPTILPSGSEIIINPVADGECVLNISQTVSKGAAITVITPKKMRVIGNLVIQ